MGDVLTLIEKATDAIDEDEAKNLMEKMMNDTFNYQDLLKQFKMIKRMGSISKILGFIPGFSQIKKQLKDADFSQFDQMEHLINSMTEAERKDPKLVDSSFKRRERIAKGAGLQVSDVNKLREALDQQKKMFKQMNNMSESDIEKLSKNPSSFTPNQPSHKKGKGKNKGRFKY